MLGVGDYLLGPLRRYLTQSLEASLSKYIRNINIETIGVGGVIVLRDLELRLGALQRSLKIPLTFEFARGFIKELKIQIPWTKLLSQPVHISVSTIEIILTARSELQFRRLQNRYRRRSTSSLGEHSVDAGVQRKVDGDDGGDRYRDQDRDAEHAQGPEQGSETEQQQSWLQDAIRRIVANATIQVSNLVLKYEHANVVLSASFRSMQLFSANPNDGWRQQFQEPQGPNRQIFKALEMKDLTVNLDSASRSDRSELPLISRASASLRALVSVDPFVGARPTTSEHHTSPKQHHARQASTDHLFDMIKRSSSSQQLDRNSARRGLSSEKDPFRGTSCMLPVTSNLDRQDIVLWRVAPQHDQNQTQGALDWVVVAVTDVWVQRLDVSVSEKQFVMLGKLMVLPQEEQQHQQHAQCLKEEEDGEEEENSGSENAEGMDEQQGQVQDDEQRSRRRSSSSSNSSNGKDDQEKEDQAHQHKQEQEQLQLPPNQDGWGSWAWNVIVGEDDHAPDHLESEIISFAAKSAQKARQQRLEAIREAKERQRFLVVGGLRVDEFSMTFLVHKTSSKRSAHGVPRPTPPPSPGPSVMQVPVANFGVVRVEVDPVTTGAASMDSSPGGTLLSAVPVMRLQADGFTLEARRVQDQRKRVDAEDESCLLLFVDLDCVRWTRVEQGHDVVLWGTAPNDVPDPMPHPRSCWSFFSGQPKQHKCCLGTSIFRRSDKAFRCHVALRTASMTLVDAAFGSLTCRVDVATVQAIYTFFGLAPETPEDLRTKPIRIRTEKGSAGAAIQDLANEYSNSGKNKDSSEPSASAMLRPVDVLCTFARFNAAFSTALADAVPQKEHSCLGMVVRSATVRCVLNPELLPALGEQSFPGTKGYFPVDQSIHRQSPTVLLHGEEQPRNPEAKRALHVFLSQATVYLDKSSSVISHDLDKTRKLEQNVFETILLQLAAARTFAELPDKLSQGAAEFDLGALHALLHPVESCRAVEIVCFVLRPMSSKSAAPVEPLYFSRASSGTTLSEGQFRVELGQLAVALQAQTQFRASVERLGVYTVRNGIEARILDINAAQSVAAVHLTQPTDRPLGVACRLGTVFVDMTGFLSLHNWSRLLRRRIDGILMVYVVLKPDKAKPSVLGTTLHVPAHHTELPTNSRWSNGVQADINIAGGHVHLPSTLVLETPPIQVKSTSVEVVQGSVGACRLTSHLQHRRVIFQHSETTWSAELRPVSIDLSVAMRTVSLDLDFERLIAISNARHAFERLLVSSSPSPSRRPTNASSFKANLKLQVKELNTRIHPMQACVESAPQKGSAFEIPQSVKLTVTSVALSAQQVGSTLESVVFGIGDIAVLEHAFPDKIKTPVPKSLLHHLAHHHVLVCVLQFLAQDDVIGVANACNVGLVVGLHSWFHSLKRLSDTLRLTGGVTPQDHEVVPLLTTMKAFQVDAEKPDCCLQADFSTDAVSFASVPLDMIYRPAVITSCAQLFASDAAMFLRPRPADREPARRETDLRPWRIPKVKLGTLRIFVPVGNSFRPQLRPSRSILLSVEQVAGGQSSASIGPVRFGACTLGIASTVVAQQHSNTRGPMERAFTRIYNRTLHVFRQPFLARPVSMSLVHARGDDVNASVDPVDLQLDMEGLQMLHQAATQIDSSDVVPMLVDPLERVQDAAMARLLQRDPVGEASPRRPTSPGPVAPWTKLHVQLPRASVKVESLVFGVDELELNSTGAASGSIRIAGMSLATQSPKTQEIGRVGRICLSWQDQGAVLDVRDELKICLDAKIVQTVSGISAEMQAIPDRTRQAMAHAQHKAWVLKETLKRLAADLAKGRPFFEELSTQRARYVIKVVFPRCSAELFTSLEVPESRLHMHIDQAFLQRQFVNSAFSEFEMMLVGFQIARSQDHVVCQPLDLRCSVLKQVHPFGRIDVKLETSSEVSIVLSKETLAVLQALSVGFAGRTASPLRSSQAQHVVDRLFAELRPQTFHGSNDSDDDVVNPNDFECLKRISDYDADVGIQPGQVAFVVGGLDDAFLERENWWTCSAHQQENEEDTRLQNGGRCVDTNLPQADWCALQWRYFEPRQLVELDLSSPLPLPKQVVKSALEGKGDVVACELCFWDSIQAAHVVVSRFQVPVEVVDEGVPSRSTTVEEFADAFSNLVELSVAEDSSAGNEPADAAPTTFPVDLSMLDPDNNECSPYWTLRWHSRAHKGDLIALDSRLAVCVALSRCVVVRSRCAFDFWHRAQLELEAAALRIAVLHAAQDDVRKKQEELFVVQAAKVELFRQTGVVFKGQDRVRASADVELLLQDFGFLTLFPVVEVQRMTISRSKSLGNEAVSVGCRASKCNVSPRTVLPMHFGINLFLQDVATLQARVAELLQQGNSDDRAGPGSAQDDVSSLQYLFVNATGRTLWFGQFGTAEALRLNHGQELSYSWRVSQAYLRPSMADVELLRRKVLGQGLTEDHVAAVVAQREAAARGFEGFVLSALASAQDAERPGSWSTNLWISCQRGENGLQTIVRVLPSHMVVSRVPRPLSLRFASSTYQIPPYPAAALAKTAKACINGGNKDEVRPPPEVKVSGEPKHQADLHDPIGFIDEAYFDIGYGGASCLGLSCPNLDGIAPVRESDEDPLVQELVFQLGRQIDWSHPISLGKPDGTVGPPQLCMIPAVPGGQALWLWVHVRQASILDRDGCPVGAWHVIEVWPTAYFVNQTSAAVHCRVRGQTRLEALQHALETHDEEESSKAWPALDPAKMQGASHLSVADQDGSVEASEWRIEPGECIAVLLDPTQQQLLSVAPAAEDTRERDLQWTEPLLRLQESIFAKVIASYGATLEVVDRKQHRAATCIASRRVRSGRPDELSMEAYAIAGNAALFFNLTAPVRVVNSTDRDLHLRWGDETVAFVKQDAALSLAWPLQKVEAIAIGLDEATWSSEIPMSATDQHIVAIPVFASSLDPINSGWVAQFWVEVTLSGNGDDRSASIRIKNRIMVHNATGLDLEMMTESLFGEQLHPYAVGQDHCATPLSFFSDDPLGVEEEETLTEDPARGAVAAKGDQLRGKQEEAHSQSLSAWLLQRSGRSTSASSIGSLLNGISEADFRECRLLSTSFRLRVAESQNWSATVLVPSLSVEGKWRQTLYVKTRPGIVDCFSCVADEVNGMVQVALLRNSQPDCMVHNQTSESICVAVPSTLLGWSSALLRRRSRGGSFNMRADQDATASGRKSAGAKSDVDVFVIPARTTVSLEWDSLMQCTRSRNFEVLTSTVDDVPDDRLQRSLEKILVQRGELDPPLRSISATDLRDQNGVNFAERASANSFQFKLAKTATSELPLLTSVDASTLDFSLARQTDQPILDVAGSLDEHLFVTMRRDFAWWDIMIAPATTPTRGQGEGTWLPEQQDEQRQAQKATGVPKVRKVLLHIGDLQVSLFDNALETVYLEVADLEVVHFQRKRWDRLKHRAQLERTNTVVVRAKGFHMDSYVPESEIPVFWYCMPAKDDDHYGHRAAPWHGQDRVLLGARWTEIEGMRPQVDLVQAELAPTTVAIEDALLRRLAHVVTPIAAVVVAQERRFQSLRQNRALAARQQEHAQHESEGRVGAGRGFVDAKVPSEIMPAASDRIYVRKLCIGELQLMATVRTTTLPMFVGIDRTQLRFSKVELADLYEGPLALQKDLMAHYVADAILGSPALLGSLEILGNPVGFVRSVGAGMYDLFSLPLGAIRHGYGAGGVLRGVARGWTSLLLHFGEGALMSVSGFSSSVARNLDRLSLDPAYAAQR
ncbi:Vacuolar protein sorting-associated protein 13B (Cohen syndrome protein 1 homolog), partial [Durusdinium trenchii]